MFQINYAMEIPEETKRLWRWRRLVSLTPFDPFKEKQAAVARQEEEWTRGVPPDRLSESYIDELINGTSWEEFEPDIAQRRRSFAATPIEQTMQGLMVPLIREAISVDPSIKSILEIGAYYGYILHLLAKEYPQISVHGVDLPSEMNRINADLVAPNLSFSSGYPLYELEKGNIEGELVLSASTFVRFKNRELHRYLDAIIKSGGRWIVVNEAMIPHQNGVVQDPITVKADYSPPVVYGRTQHPHPPCYHHNYKAIFESKGFRIQHYRIYAPFGNEDYRIELVARR